MAKVTVIPSTIQTSAFGGRIIPKERVAGYARVSTDSDEQFTSFEAQRNIMRSSSDQILIGSLLRFILIGDFRNQHQNVMVSIK